MVSERLVFSGDIGVMIGVAREFKENGAREIGICIPRVMGADRFEDPGARLLA